MSNKALLSKKDSLEFSSWWKLKNALVAVDNFITTNNCQTVGLSEDRERLLDLLFMFKIEKSSIHRT